MYSEEFESYFRLLWLLVLFVSVLITCLCYLYIAMRKARRKESESLVSFSLVLEGQEAERQRIAAELHDTVLPNLKDNTVAARVREICGHLMPPDFTRFNLKDSLVSLGDSFVKRTGIKCIVEIADDLDLGFLGTEQQLQLYRIVQEAFNNIGKHSNATQSMLIARNGGLSSASDTAVKQTAPQFVLLSVSDDGAGLKDLGNGGFGMRIMRQRASLLGARLDFISEEGNGCMVCEEIPRSEGKL
jgi:two-component system NarL family sensor kinase